MRAGSVSWKGVDPMTLGVHRHPPLGLGLIQREIAGVRVIMRAAGSWYRLLPSAGAGAHWADGIDSGGAGVGGSLCMSLVVWGAEVECVWNNHRMTDEALCD